MTPRRDWTEWHLTPRGWERGATRAAGKNNWAEDPEDRVASFVYKEVETSAAPETTRSVEESWREKTVSDGEIAALLREHGECPREL